MRILVTGANGYLGQGVTKSLLDQGNEVVAADFMLNNVDERAIKKECDMFALCGDLYEYFEKPDVVLHMAWRDGFVHNSLAHLEDLPKHYLFLKEFAESEVKAIACMGTMHEIGFWEGSINENTPCNPTTLYGISKNALRQSLSELCKTNKKQFLWLRGFYIVGNPKFGNSIFSKIYKKAEEGEKTFPFTSGKNQYDFIDYNDFCNQVSRSVIQSNVDGIINIGIGEPESLASRVERFIKEYNLDIKLDYGKFPDRPYDSKAVWGDHSKIEKIMEL